MTRDRASCPSDINTSTPQRAPKAMLVPQLLGAGIEMLNVKLIYFSTLTLLARSLVTESSLARRETLSSVTLSTASAVGIDPSRS